MLVRCRSRPIASLLLCAHSVLVSLTTIAARKTVLMVGIMAAHALGEGCAVGVSFCGERGWAQVCAASLVCVCWRVIGVWCVSLCIQYIVCWLHTQLK
jgi:hypothetical protein